MPAPRPFVLAARALAATRDLLYPLRCVGCGRFGEYLCAGCIERAPALEARPHCANCMAPWDEDLNCPRCFQWDALDGARARFLYDGAARRAIRALKYRNGRPLAPVLAELLAPLVNPGELVIPVPMHPSRQRRRGYNQAELIARHLPAAATHTGLLRARKTRAQFGLGATERRRNVAGAFRYEGPSFEGASILLVDDVVTTGATANECARELKDHGAGHVIALAFARANVDLADPQLCV